MLKVLFGNAIKVLLQRLKAHLSTKMYLELVELQEKLPKFIHLATLFGRTFALCINSGALKPEGHKRAVYVGVVDITVSGRTFVFTAWLVSFPKRKWNELPEEKKWHFD